MSVKVNALPSEINPALTDNTINDSGNTTTKRTTWQKILNLFIANGVAISTYEKGITAHAGGGQSLAYILTKTKSRVDTTVTDLDSVKFTTANAGSEQEVYNYGSADMNVYPASGDNFLGMSANVPILVVNGNSLKVFCFETGTWTLL